LFSRLAVQRHDGAWPARHQEKAADRERFGWAQRVLIVIPGLDPGICAYTGGWSDPRIKSGDDDSGKSYPDARVVWPATNPWPAMPRGKTERHA
jgi:hypothetical protein